MTEQEEPRAVLWRPLRVRGIPVHLAAPALALALGLALLASGGIAAVLGAWVLTAGFPLAVGAFVADPRALAAPAVVWAGWLVVVQLSGSGSSLPRTPLALALVLAGLGAAAVWLAQRAVLPAVEGAEPEARHTLPDLDELLAPPQVPPLLDATDQVDEALADLLDEPIDEEALEATTEAEAASAPDHDADQDDSASTTDDDDPRNDTGHVIEFEAIRED